MPYRQIGSSTLSVSEIGFGCMSLDVQDNNSAAILHRALEAGINLFDTADIYQHGENETFVGKVLKPHRANIILATKVGNQWKPDNSGLHWNPSKKHILESVEGSLRRLQTDYIDLYQLHGGTIEDPIDETIEAFELLQQSGKIRYYGISSIRHNVIKAYVQRSNIVSVMTQYSLLDRRPEEWSLGFLKENQIGVLARGGLAQGLLVNKPAKPYLGHDTAAVAQAATAVQSFSSAQRNAAQTALGYVLHHPVVSSAITGIRTMQQLEDVLQTGNTPALSDKEAEVLQQSTKTLLYTDHRI